MKYIPFKGPGFTLERPKSWTVTASLEYQSMFADEVNEWGLRPNLLLALRPIQDEVTLVDVMEQARLNAERELTGYTIIQEVDQSAEGWVQRQYGWVRPDDNLGIVQTQRFYKSGNFLFAFTGTRTEHEAQYDDIFLNILNSFQLTPPSEN